MCIYVLYMCIYIDGLAQVCSNLSYCSLIYIDGFAQDCGNWSYCSLSYGSGHETAAVLSPGFAVN